MIFFNKAWRHTYLNKVSVKIFIALFLLSCSKTNKEEIIKMEKRSKLHQKKMTTKKNVSKPLYLIQPNEVVVVVPTTQQLDSLQNAMEDDEYSTFVDESTFYVTQAKEYFDNIHSRLIEVDSGQDLFFVLESGKKIPFSTKNLIWEIIAFNGNSKPELIDVTNVQDEMIRVYNKAKQKKHNQ